MAGLNSVFQKQRSRVLEITQIHLFIVIVTILNFIISLNLQMWATSKKSRMVSQLELETGGSEQSARIRDIHSIEGRVVVLCLSTWYFGVALTQISDITPQMWIFDFSSLLVQQQGVGPLFSLVPWGAAVGVIINHFIMNKFNRRIYLVILNVLCIVFTGLLQIPNTPCLYVFRILQGLVAGMYMNFIPTYISELVPKELGSRFGVYPQISVVLGVLVSFVVAMIMTDVFGLQSNSSLVTEEQAEIFWRVMLALPAVGPILQMIFLAFGYIPQSPYSLIVRNRRENARDVLALFYEQEYVNLILEDREKAVFQQSSNNLEQKVEWTGRGYFKGFLLAIFQVLTGIVCYVTQAGHVMTVALNQPAFGVYTPILLTISQLIGTLISVPMLKHIEWRYLTIIGGFTLAVFNAITGVFFYLFDIVDQNYKDMCMAISMISIMAFMFTFGISVGSSVWPYVGYMMPGSAVLVSQVINWVLSGAGIVCFSLNTYYYTSNNPFIIIFAFCGITFFLSIINAFTMIDIKGLSVRRVQKELAK